MSKKRSRQDLGSTQVMFRRKLTPLSLKRPRNEEELEVECKKMRIHSLKRHGEFIEENLHKRMRYSKPSVEEAIAFLLPHIQELQHLYNGEVELNSAKSAHILDVHNLLQQEISAKQQVMSNNKTILTAYHKVTAENNQLKRELDLMKYRLNLM